MATTALALERATATRPHCGEKQRRTQRQLQQQQQQQRHEKTTSE